MIDIVGECELVVIGGKACLKSGHPSRTGIDSEIERFSVVGVLKILRWVRPKQMGAAIAHLGHIVEPKVTRRNLAADCHSDFLERQKAALVVEGVHKGAVHGSLKPGSLMERGIVVADGRVIAPDA